MKQYNRLSKSFGLIVKTKSGQIVLLRRKIPYCLQDFYYYLHKKKVPYSSDSEMIRAIFNEEYAPQMDPQELVDYERYLRKEPFEDMYDFPHGQLPYSLKRQATLSNLHIFYAAYREFQEESGFKFSVQRSKIEHFPLVCVKFTGCNDLDYEQSYYIVDNVTSLKRCFYFETFKEPCRAEKPISSWDDDRLIYEGQLISIEEAYRLLLKQQSIKVDLKHWLCLNTNLVQKMLSHDDLINEAEMNDHFKNISLPCTSKSQETLPPSTHNSLSG